jgi:hypothetical protein
MIIIIPRLQPFMCDGYSSRCMCDGYGSRSVCVFLLSRYNIPATYVIYKPKMRYMYHVEFLDDFGFMTACLLATVLRIVDDYSAAYVAFILKLNVQSRHQNFVCSMLDF